MQYQKLILLCTFFLIILSSVSLAQNVGSTKNVGFIPNQGQFLDEKGNAETVFGMIVNEKGQELWLCRQGIVLKQKEGQSEVSSMRLQFDSPLIQRKSIIFEEPLSYTINYFYPHCPHGILNVKAYKRIRIENVYPNIDLELSISSTQEVEQKYTARKGKSILYKPIVYKVQDSKGRKYADTVNLDSSKAIFSYLSSMSSTSAHSRNTFDNSSNIVWGTYWSGASIYDWSTMVREEDPFKLLQKTYFSLSSSTLDSLGNLYIVGKDKSLKFPFQGQDTSYISKDSVTPDYDAFIAKFTSDGSLRWATYYGSSMYDEATVVKFNKENELYVAGCILQPLYTHLGLSQLMKPGIFKHWENDFPVQFQAGAINEQKGALFVLKFNTDGERLWASLCGPNQSNEDSICVVMRPLTIEIDVENQLYLSGYFHSARYSKKQDFDMRTGKKLAVFGTESAFLYSADTLKHRLLQNYTPTRRFLLKFDARDTLVWSTDLPTYYDILGLKCDKKQNLYVYGKTVLPDQPRLLQKEGAYFGQYKLENEELQLEGYPYLMQFDSKGILRWCTHIGSGLEPVDFVFSYDLLITEEDHVLLTGGSASTHPLLEKEGAFNLSRERLGKKSLAYLTEFDENGKMIWSTFYTHKNRQSLGHSLQSDLSGGFYLLSILADSTKDDFMNVLGQKNNLLLSHFNKKRQLVSEQKIACDIVPLTIINFLNFGDNLNSWFYPMEEVNIESAYTQANLSLNLSPKGQLYLTGNTHSLSPSLLRKPNENSYFQDTLLVPKKSLSGFMLSVDLCDTSSYPPLSMGLKDSLYCANLPFSLTIQIPDTAYPEHRIVWNAGTANESESSSYTINKTGVYFVEARSIYPSCPSIYGDTIHIDTLAHPVLHFPQDTLKRCVGDGVYPISATNPNASYLWSDGSTDSIYLLRYTGEAMVNLSCTVTNACGFSVTDTLIARFFPPYAYLGKDTVLCNTETLLLNMQKLNASVPATLQYIWIFNGDTIEGGGMDNSEYLISPGDSGTLIVEVHWPASDCKIARDTLHFSYYPYPNVNAVINDTIICVNTEAVFYADIAQDGPDVKVQWFTALGELLGEVDSIILNEAGIYSLKLQNYCSQSITSFELFHYPLWWTELSIPIDTFKCEDFPLLLDVRVHNHPTIYEWGDIVGESSGVREFTRDGEYELRLTDSMACSRTYSISIRTEDCNPILKIPNVFTPNDDGFNDLLKAVTQEQIYDFTIEIFDSWGLSVQRYKGEVSGWNWNGKTKNGKAVADGAYFWIALFKDFKGAKKKESGCVMLLR